MEAQTNRETHLYRDVLRTAWRIVWKHKFLMILGFFAAFAANGEQYDILHKNVDSVVRLQTFLPVLPQAVTGTVAQFWTYFRQLIIEGAFLDTQRFDALLLFIALFIGPIVLAQIGIIASTREALKERGKPSFGLSMRDGGRFFLPVLLINILVKGIVYVLLALVSYPIFLRFLSSGGSKATLDGLAVAAFLCLVPLQIILSFLSKFASAYVVIEGKPIGQAIRDAIRLFGKHWLIAVEMSFLLILINLIASITLIGTLSLVGFPSGPFSLLLMYAAVIFLGSLLAAFQYSAWTTLFLQLRENRGVSKIARWADMIAATLGARHAASK